MAAISANPEIGCQLGGPAGDVPSLGCLAQVVANVIQWALVFLGAVAILFLLIGSAQLIISRGDAKALQKAKGTITYAIIGTVAVLGAFALIAIFTNTFGLPNILQNFTFYQR